MMIEDLQRQVMQLIPRLAMRNMELHCDIDNRDLESNFENLYHNHVLVLEQYVQDKQYGDLSFRVELSEFYASHHLDRW
jgi:hypothetical protein